MIVKWMIVWFLFTCMDNETNNNFMTWPPWEKELKNLGYVQTNLHGLDSMASCEIDEWALP
jgi:hypothetical protein